MAEKTVAVPETQDMTTKPEGTRMRERYVTPPADIYEMSEKLVVMADVPGVTPDHLDVRVDNHLLTIRGQASVRFQVSQRIVSTNWSTISGSSSSATRLMSVKFPQI